MKKHIILLGAFILAISSNSLHAQNKIEKKSTHSVTEQTHSVIPSECCKLKQEKCSKEKACSEKTTLHQAEIMEFKSSDKESIRNENHLCGQKSKNKNSNLNPVKKCTANLSNCSKRIIFN